MSFRLYFHPENKPVLYRTGMLEYSSGSGCFSLCHGIKLYSCVRQRALRSSIIEVSTLLKDLPVPRPPLKPTTVSYLMKYGLMIKKSTTHITSIIIIPIATAEEGAD